MKNDDTAADAAQPPLAARVERIPLTRIPRPPGWDSVRLTIHAHSPDLAVARYLEQAAAQAAPGRDLTAVITLGTINSPDAALVRSARLAGRRLVVDVTLRVFEGRLAANVQHLAVAVVELGRLAPGRYDGEVRVERFVFTDYDHPERARQAHSSTHRVAFEVAGN